MTITLANATSTDITGVNMVDTLLAPGIIYTTNPALATTCSPGVVTDDTADSPNTVTLTNGTIPHGSNCKVNFNVTSLTATTWNNQIAVGGVCGYQAATQVCNASASNNAGLTVNASTLPVTGTKSFGSPNILPGTNTLLTINVTAPSDTSLSNVSVTDNLSNRHHGHQ